jgi:hypothetical protein
MTGSASVHSLQALYDWHAALCVFRTEAIESLASISLEIQRSESWLDDQLHAWQREVREAEQDVTRCRTELANRKFPDFSGRIPDCSVQEEALWAAEDRLEHAREQIGVVRNWYHRLPKMINEEYQGPARHLTNFMEADLPRAIAMLNGQIASLEAYLNLKVEQVPAAVPTPAPAEPKKDPS